MKQPSSRKTPVRRTPVSRTTTRKTTRKSRAKKGHSRWSLWIHCGLIAVFFIILFSFFVGKKGHLGIDVSHHQGKINWEQVVKSGNVEFAYIKATEGSDYVDKLFKHNLKEARAQGIPVGPYHFFRADKSGKSQFEHFSKIIGNEFDLIPVLDLEEMGGKIKDKEAYRKEVQSFIDLFVSHYGYTPIVYGSHSFMKDYVHPVARNCDYWLAWYLPLSKAIRDKRRFINGVRPGLHPRIWQYSDKGNLPGITGDVDLDECWEIQDLLKK